LLPLRFTESHNGTDNHRPVGSRAATSNAVIQPPTSFDVMEVINLGPVPVKQDQKFYVRFKIIPAFEDSARHGEAKSLIGLLLIQFTNFMILVKNPLMTWQQARDEHRDLLVDRLGIMKPAYYDFAMHLQVSKPSKRSRHPKCTGELQCAHYRSLQAEMFINMVQAVYNKDRRIFGEMLGDYPGGFWGEADFIDNSTRTHKKPTIMGFT
jgi:hypothetical protein